MRFPKNRANLYLVVRLNTRTVVGSFSNTEDADDFATACEQEWLDKVGEEMPHRVELTTYYG